LREKIQTQTRGYVSRFKPLLYVPASYRRIKTIHYRIFYKGTSTEELQITTLKYTTPSLTLLHKREQQSPLHKRENKSKDENTT